MRIPLNIAGILTLLPPFAFGVVMTTPRIEVILHEPTCFSLYGGTIDGVPLNDHVATIHTVLYVSGIGWAGGAHGNEVVEKTSILCDGISQEVAEQPAFQGERIEFTKSSVLAECFKVSYRLILDNGVLEEHINLVCEKEATLQKCYPWLCSHSNSLTECLFLGEHGGSLLISATDQDDKSYTAQLSGVWAIAQYDLQTEHGLCTVFSEGTDTQDALWFIWDSTVANKIYCRCCGYEGQIPTGKQCSVCVRRYAFTAVPDKWQDEAAAKVLRQETDFRISRETEEWLCLSWHPRDGFAYRLEIGDLFDWVDAGPVFPDASMRVAPGEEPVFFRLALTPHIYTPP